MKYFSLLICLSLLPALKGYSQAPDLEKGLIAYYRFDADAKDASGNGNHGRIVGQVEPVEDRFGNACGAMYFDGRRSYITVPDSRSLSSPYKSLTLSAWFLLYADSEISGIKWATICCKSDLSYEDDQTPHYRLQPTEWTVSLNTEFTEACKTQWDFGVWYHYAMVYDGSTVTAYMNGEKIYEDYYHHPLEANPHPLNIGRDLPGNLEYLHGTLDDLRMYNRALSKNEVMALYRDDADKTHFVSPCGEPAPSTPLAYTPPATDPAPTPAPTEEDPFDFEAPTAPAEETPVYTDEPTETEVPMSSSIEIEVEGLNPTPPAGTAPTDPGVPTTIGGDIIEYQQTIYVDQPDIIIFPYDHQKEDGDTVSININGVWILDKYMIQNRSPKTRGYNLTLQPHVTTYLISKAWNLGDIPPNTLTIEIHDKINPPRRVKINSEIGKSGAIKIVYQPRGDGR